MRGALVEIVVASLCLGPITARAQFGGAAIFEPEIGIVNSGVVMDAQATVSADRKYVTMNMRAAQSQCWRCTPFNFKAWGMGLAGWWAVSIRSLAAVHWASSFRNSPTRR